MYTEYQTPRNKAIQKLLRSPVTEEMIGRFIALTKARSKKQINQFDRILGTDLVWLNFNRLCDVESNNGYSLYYSITTSKQH
jgi:hypothetical protein